MGGGIDGVRWGGGMMGRSIIAPPHQRWGGNDGGLVVGWMGTAVEPGNPIPSHGSGRAIPFHPMDLEGKSGQPIAAHLRWGGE